jgi:DNA-binding MarR family transcriptional regulator
MLLTSFEMSTRSTTNTASEDATAAFSAALHDFFRAARRARGRAARRSDPEGLSLAQYHLLEPLADGPSTNRQLAAAADVSSPTATRMIDVLVARDLVTRVEDPTDRRAVLISLTPRGRRALEAKMREYDAARRQIAAAFDPDERRVAAGLIERITEVIEEL